MQSRTIIALKALAVKLGCAETVAAVQGETVDEVINFIAEKAAITANGLVLKDANDVIYDVTVTTAGVLQATARS